MTDDEQIKDMQERLKEYHMTLCALVRQAGGKVRLLLSELEDLPANPTLISHIDDSHDELVIVYGGSL